MIEKITRRDLLKSAAASALLAIIDGCGSPKGPAAPLILGARAQSFRFVHLTDIHIQPELDGDKGFAAALRAVENLRPQPDFILTGGDLIFDGLEVDATRARSLFELYKKVLADNTSLPVFNTVGNHDVFGWASKGAVKPDSVGYGKAMAKDYLQLPETYHSFEHKGWRFLCLDNIQPGAGTPHSYQGFIDGPQLDWLKEQLQKTDPATPIVICEHIPTVTVTSFGHDELVQGPEWRLENNLVCTDSAQRLAIYRSRNVRLSLSGHIHERDRAEFLGTTFINDGAVCGSWWKGPHRGVEEGFGIIDVRGDGTFLHQYFDYGWQARPA